VPRYACNHAFGDEMGGSRSVARAILPTTDSLGEPTPSHRPIARPGETSPTGGTAGRFSDRSWHSIACALLMGVLAACAAGSKSSTPAPSHRPGTLLPDQPTEALIEELDDPGNASDAARTLIVRAWSDRSVASAINETLRGGPSTARGALLDAIAGEPVAPESVWPGVSALLPTLETEEQRVQGLHAVASFATRQAALVLLTHARPDQSESVRSAAFEGLARLSGHEDFGSDLDQWERWYIEGLSLTGRTWILRLLHDRALRADTLDRRTATLGRRLADANRRLYQATDNPDRPALLAEFLLSDVDQVRGLGIELVRQNLAGGQPVAPPVSDAALSLLEHTRARVRAESARLIRQAALQAGREPVLDALERERDPQAAEALLAAAARWPDPRALDPALRWLETGGRVASVAAELAWKLYTEGMLDDQIVQTRALELLRLHGLEVINGAGCRLLVALGEPADHERVAGLLSSERIDLKLNAARALMDLERYTEAIVRAASTDPRLLDTAVRAVRTTRPSPEGFALLATLGPGTSDAARRGLLDLANDLSAEDLIVIGTDDRYPIGLRESVLTMLLAPERLPAPDGDASIRSAYARGIFSLSALRLLLERPEETLSALATAEPIIPEDQRPRANALRVEALLRLGRIDEAWNVPDVGAEPWIDALADASEPAIVAALIQRIEERFTDSLTEAQQATLDNARSLVSKASETPGQVAEDAEPEPPSSSPDQRVPPGSQPPPA